MPTSHPHTVGGADAKTMMRDEDEDNDICPVCDGECTCANNPRFLHTTSTALVSSSSIPTGSNAASDPSSGPIQKLPSLKIRLTIPPSMLGKRRASFSNSKHLGSTTSASAVGGGAPTNPRPSTSFSAQYGVAPKRKGRPPKSLSSARQLGIKSGNDPLSFYHSSQATRKHNPPLKKSIASRIPKKLKGKDTTIKKSSAAKRRRVESTDSEMDDHYHFDSDNDVARNAQLPTFLPASVLSSSESEIASSSGFESDSSVEADEDSFINSQESQKLRVRRELLGDDGQKRRHPHDNWVIRPRKRSVGPSDIDMEIGSDATEDEEEEQEEQEAEEEDDEADDMPVGSGYIGVATGWSEEDEESSFDADLFFTNLTDSDSDDDHPYPQDEHDNRGDDGDQSDMDSASLSDAALTGLIPRLRWNLEHLPFELMEDWDGQVTFSNGIGDGRALLDVDFELNANHVEASISPSQESDNGECSDSDENGEFEGDTTDEDLVGEDHLPNERAMRMFKLPFSVSSINPLSTMSPSVSPAPRNCQLFGSQGTIDSPMPADILSGRVFLEDSVNPDDYDDDAPSVSSKGNGPTTGAFIPTDTVRAIIDDTHANVPSPHPRVRSRRGKAASQGRPSPKHSLLSRQLSLPPISQPSFQRLSSSELTTSPQLPTQAIDLDDVLDTAFLDEEPSEELSTSATQHSRKHLNLSRWGWGSDTPTADYDKVIRNSPLSLLWQGKDLMPIKPGFASRVRDGDRTPTNARVHHQPPLNNIPVNAKKEPRRERKLKQKHNLGYGRPPHQQHHFRQHHPNLKTRSSSSSQRNHSFNTSPPATNV
ncbi:hypothetical protein GGX14DRAFT_557347 [Mycena pura]|uniref:Uncharacterized protein n=1 Tax=Mycena pura TaxID=153505 RepID=A0AAD7E2A6_9AGAR|nr:hypothetical protein GGX14DRAFT_557347 [Mycena pura]